MVPGTALSVAAPDDLKNGEIKIGFRPEHARIVPSGGQIEGRLSRIWFEGADEVLGIDRGDLHLKVRISGSRRLDIGDSISLVVPDERLRLFCGGRLVA